MSPAFIWANTCAWDTVGGDRDVGDVVELEGWDVVGDEGDTDVWVPVVVDEGVGLVCVGVWVLDGEEELLFCEVDDELGDVDEEDELDGEEDCPELCELDDVDVWVLLDEDGGEELLCELDEDCVELCELDEDACIICSGEEGSSPIPLSLKSIVWTGDCNSPIPAVILKAGISISTSSDPDGIIDVISTYWFGDNVYDPNTFPVVGSSTWKVRVFGYKFSRYTSPEGELELDDVDEGVLADEELLFCEQDEEQEGEEHCEQEGEDEGEELCELGDDELVDDELPCIICSGEEGSSPIPYWLKYIVWTGDCNSPWPIVILKLGITISTSPDSGDITDEISTYWFGDSVYVCEFPVIRSTTLNVRVCGYRFSKYTSPIFTH